MNYNYTSNPTPERNRAILSLLESGKTLKEIGDKFNLTRERVRQISTARGTKSAESVRRFKQSGLAKAKASEVSALVMREGFTVNLACDEAGTYQAKIDPFLSDNVRVKSRRNLALRSLQQRIGFCETLRPLVILDGLTLSAAGRSIGLSHGHANYIARELAPELVHESKRIHSQNLKNRNYVRGSK